VIELVHFDGYTLQESAEILRETLANTRNYYYRGLKALRMFLEAQPEVAVSRRTSVLERNDAYGFQS
jgi:DNA-directed RNA polymerase specialized sigma24 family protein